MDSRTVMIDYGVVDHVDISTDSESFTFDPCSVFLFEKCIAEKLHKPRRREIVTNVLKREVRLLTQLRHPYLLHVLCPIEETKFGGKIACSRFDQLVGKRDEDDNTGGASHEKESSEKKHFKRSFFVTKTGSRLMLAAIYGLPDDYDFIALSAE
ncbi:hypothetical protein PHET_00210 [Paragonimus heterotremus]|uniref:Protein kinase domain-containing protein n=1 Tax=Paragonimus heterotremus TaxID=100268 RepID=A0A8J4SVE3_9TREM|nr:hypothetical protein PHET_00210 [Paragonimus heterotremus]